MAVRCGGIAGHRCPDPAHQRDRQSPGSGDPQVTCRGCCPRGPPAPAGRGPTGDPVSTGSLPPARGRARSGSAGDRPATDSPGRLAAHRPPRRSRRGDGATIAPRIVGSRPVIGAIRRLTVNFGECPPSFPAESLQTARQDPAPTRAWTVPLPRSRAGATASGPGSLGSGTSPPLRPGRGPAWSRRVAGRRPHTLTSRHAIRRSAVGSTGLVMRFFAHFTRYFPILSRARRADLGMTWRNFLHGLPLSRQGRIPQSGVFAGGHTRE
jgi:hypothetical protein